MKIYLGLGTNLGDKERNLHQAVRMIAAEIGEVSALSSFYSTEPWGFQSEHSFLNAACCVEVGDDLMAGTPQETVFEVLRRTQRIEREMGRTLKSADGVYHDRIIDIDLLLAFATDGTLVCIHEPALKLPHPLMHERDFVMRPLGELL